jgi:hypothetical protein
MMTSVDHPSYRAAFGRSTKRSAISGSTVISRPASRWAPRPSTAALNRLKQVEYLLKTEQVDECLFVRESE